MTKGSGAERLKKKPMIKWYGKLFYGAGNLGYGVVSQTMSTFIMFFGTVACGLSGTLMGIAVAIGTVWDAVTDPLVGSLSDRYNGKMLGRRHMFLIIGVFGMAIVNVFLWNAYPAMGQVGMFLWFMVFIVLLETFNTLFATPYVALGIDLSGDYHEQTVIQSCKSIFFLLGMIIPTVLMAVLKSGHAETDLTPYRNMAYLCSTLAIIFGLTSFFGTFSHLPRLKAKAVLSGVGVGGKRKTFRKIIRDFFRILKSRHYRAVVVGYAVSLMAAAFLTGVGFHTFTYSFRLPGTLMYLLMGALFLMTIVFQPLWVYLSDRFGKKRALLFGMSVTLFGIVYVAAVFLLRGSILPNEWLLVGLLLPGLMLVGIGTGSMYSLPIAMLADTIACDTVESGQDKTATCSGFMTFAYKVSQSAAMLVIGVLLDVIGFNAAAYTDGAGGIDYGKIPPQVSWGLGLILVLGVILAMVGGMIAYGRYNLKKEDVPVLDEALNPEYRVESFPRQIGRGETQVDEEEEPHDPNSGEPGNRPDRDA